MGNFKNTVRLSSFPARRRKRVKKHQLRWLELEITRRCPLACLHCGSGCSDKTPYARELSEAEIIAVFKRMASVYDPAAVMVNITGGEPMLRSDLFRIMARITEMGYKLTMVTSGFLLDEKSVDLLAAAGLSTISVSLDGLEATHNWLRGNPESFSRATTALQLLKKSGYFQEIEAITTVNKRNLPELSALKELLGSIDIENWRLFKLFPIGRALENQELLIGPAELKTLLRFILNERKNSSFRHIAYCEEGFFGPDYEYEIRDSIGQCWAGVNMLAILADGSLIGCAAVSHDFIQGNLLKDDIVDIWENSFSEFRDRSWMTEGVCGDCKQHRYCNGDSMHLWEKGKKNPAACHYQMLHGNRD